MDGERVERWGRTYTGVLIVDRRHGNVPKPSRAQWRKTYKKETESVVKKFSTMLPEAENSKNSYRI
jgi:hypothetical protein